ncbi:DUF916 domain-containing protein [Candidatus Falkowbacteria bacterium]|nr:DUF916 domain-containing protein [Candidatus Falkowbacteria bacterium]
MIKAMKKAIITIMMLSFGLFFADICQAEDSSAFTITPPLIKMNMEPGEMITSGIKVINNNDRTLIVHATAVNFKSADNGKVEFADEDDVGGNYTLKEWITLPQKEFIIPPYGSKNVPYILEVPKDASPGGHYAGILIGTSPSKEKSEGAMIGVSQVVSSLLFVSIKGEILEKGYIREFTTDKHIYYGTDESIAFDVRFQNTGNVHLKPVGEIKIIDMFGKEKAKLAMNEKTDYGNILPESERSWSLDWSIGDELVLINRYRAVLSVTFGEQAKQSDYQEKFFWVVDVKLLSIILSSLAVFVIILIVIIKAYIKRSVQSVQKQIEMQTKNWAQPPARKQEKKERKIVDLRNRRK